MTPGGIVRLRLDWTCRTYNERLSGCKLTPLSQRSSVGWFKNVAAVEMALVVEVVVDRDVNGGEFLRRVLMSLNLAIAPSRRQNGWGEFSARLLSH